MIKQALLLPLLILSSFGCASAPKDTLMQVSTIDALLAGAYDGQMTLGELKTHGNLGIGTFDALAGEMIVLDGAVYQAKSDGAVVEMPDQATTPFAAVVTFCADQSIPISDPLSETELKAKIDKRAPNKNIFLALRIDGSFPFMKIRSVPGQKKPYPPLADVVKHQVVYEHTNVTGTVLGFRCPAFVKGINVPNYHLHFISDDRKIGGHILDFTTGQAQLQLDACNRFYMVLTDREEFSSLDLSKDRSQELEKVEK